MVLLLAMQAWSRMQLGLLWSV